MNTQLPSLQEVVRLWTTHQQDAARRLLYQIVQQHPQNEQAWLWMARAARNREELYKSLQRVLQINPQNNTARQIMQKQFPAPQGAPQPPASVDDILAEAVFSDNPRQAEALYKQVLQLQPGHPDAVIALYDYYVAQENMDAARALIGYARAYSPDAPGLARRQIDLALRTRNLEMLREMGDLLLTHPVITAEILLQAGEVFAGESQYNVVVKLLERAAELDDTNQTVKYGLARAYEVTEEKEKARNVLKTIADIDRKSGIGQHVMNRLLEEDPYVPLSMRENTLIALREVAGLMLPILLLVLFDNGMSFLVPADRYLAPGLGFLGGYMLVTATSSHEQKIIRWLIQDELNETVRWILGGVGTVMLILALGLSLQTSIQRIDETGQYRQDACEELIPRIEKATRLTIRPHSPDEACDALNELIDRYYRYERDERLSHHELNRG